jgi:predicted ATPase/class 3 adenylate cyclase
MADLPSGTVTFLFTDLEGSTRLWEEHPTAMQAALAHHDKLVREAIESHNGHVVKFTGDGFHAAFATAHDALGAALAAQQALVRAEWTETGPLRARMGVHTGEAQHRDGDYHGTALNRAARLTGVAHGGQIVVSAVTEGLVSDDLPDGMELVDLGEHRLRDLAQPIRVFQIEHTTLPARFPPLRSVDTYPTNLPVQLSSFIGREHELEVIADALTRDRLVTLTGVGGVGKTRLAVHAAALLLPNYRDGVWLSELASAADTDSMSQIIAAAVGAVPKDGMTLADGTVEYLRDRVVLLVLDNCEHLLEPASRFAADLLSTCRNVRVLATSREGLGVDGERVLPLRSLAVPERADLSSVVTSTAAQLFIQRARAVAPEFTANEGNASAVTDICRRLDGIPLAIELAAARTTVMSAGEIATHLDERFRLLTGGRRTAVERHHTLRATVDWSYSLLAERDRSVFDRLGVFAGGFDADAAIAVAATEGIESWDVLDALGSLVAKSMVDAERRGDAATRYTLLETLRQYARERLDEDGDADADAWRQRHAAHYAAFAELAAAGFNGQDEIAWHGRVSEDLDNVRAAFIWSLDSRLDDGETAMRIVAVLAIVSFRQRRLGIAEWAERARTRVERTTPGRRSAVLAAAALHALNNGDFPTARAIALSALRDGLPADCPNPSLPYISLCISEALSGRPDRAVEILDGEARRALEGVGAAPFEHIMLTVLRLLFGAMFGDFRIAEGESTLALARTDGRPSVLAEMLFTTAWVVWRDKPDLARDRLEESISLMRAGATDSVLGHALALLGQIRASLGDYDVLGVLRESIVRSNDASRSQLASAMDRAMRVFAVLDRPKAVAVIGGALAEGQFRDLSILPPTELPDRRGALATAHDQLGPEEYEQLLTRGAAMSYDDLVQSALAAVDELIAERGDD